MRIAAELEIDKTFVVMNEEECWKISKFIKDASLLDYEDKEDIEKAVSLMTRLHQSGKSRQEFVLS